LYLFTVEENCKYSLGGTSIRYDLVCKEEVLIIVLETFPFFGLGGILEQENEAINRMELLQ